MADKVLQDPTKQKFFDQQSMHELFELPKKSQGNFIINLRDTDKSEKRPQTQSITLTLPDLSNRKRQKLSEIEEVKRGNQEQGAGLQELEEGEIEFFKPERMYELNPKNLKKDEKAQ